MWSITKEESMRIYSRSFVTSYNRRPLVKVYQGASASQWPPESTITGSVEHRRDLPALRLPLPPLTLAFTVRRIRRFWRRVTGRKRWWGGFARGWGTKGYSRTRMVRIQVEKIISLRANEIVGRRGSTASNPNRLRPSVQNLQ